ncbi:MAG: 2-C-methyl-D-erythritol 2,4-cyclodiphosphate synthase [Defluviitaleaceae bacterium]|nr:2-C-methyl-D-erythritol 2,4-cyclodiphosphate synthase [Defluviitaleaceae bacterium]
MRIGTGYDVHRLEEGRRLIIGGVDIPHRAGLAGHSDADVLAHAVMDALLGAATLGDIGRHFPDDDTAYKDACSMDLMRKVGEKVRARGYQIVNIDATVIAQNPRMAPYIDEICGNIGEALGVCATQINVKATTEEGLGFTGAELGIAAQAVCLLDTAT